LLAKNGLDEFYNLSERPGVRVRKAAGREQWAYLDEPALQQKLLDFTDGKVSRITFQIPAIHCIACVWLLENLFRLHAGIGKSQVNFPKREAAITFAPKKIRLSELVTILASVGYEPVLTLSGLEQRKTNPVRHRQWLQIGIAGFAFGNLMLFSLPAYLGMDRFNAPLFKGLFGYLSLALALPVVLYSASDYWKSAALSVKQRVLTLDVPIALGLAALYAQSAFEVLCGRGDGYLDSLAGLVFFLLCGRAFQQKTHDRLAFDRDYKSFFPLSVTRKTSAGEHSVALSNLRVGNRLLLRNGELIPADARLVSGPALIDYSFVTGESEPVVKAAGDYLYAGGQQVGGSIEVETVKEVSQSYLTSLWNHDAFQKKSDDTLNTLTNRYSRRFTRIVIGVAVVAALFWLVSGNPARGMKAFTSVLIVACPCALALAAPFTLGTAQRLLGRAGVFLKNADVLERIAEIDAIVFDKTGTLTTSQAEAVTFHAASDPLTKFEQGLVYSITRHSTHPHSVRISESLATSQFPEAVRFFIETPGCGIEGNVQGREVWLGSRAWLESYGVAVGNLTLRTGSTVFLAIDGKFRGAFVLANALRPEIEKLLRSLCNDCEIALLSGDNERERERFKQLFGSAARVHFNQSPLNKLGFIRRLQDSGRTVMMVGDGLNDAGALKQSDVGVAVVEKLGAFSPASDAILEAGRVPELSRILSFARKATTVVRLSFGLSGAYNLVGISVAAAGILSPLICAILMPLSSISVVLFVCGMTRWIARREGVGN
jgi:Cu+-exporting ATPase